jgi:trans-aconitate 2-methyltransferase
MDKDKDWSAAQYLKFERERTRPARDLLAQVAVESPARVLDVGCGPGNSTRLLVERWPSARISGLDSSPDMIEKARKRLPEVDFRIGDLTTTTIEGYDLLFANAVYQWLRHDQRMGIFVDMMTKQKPGGVFAFQVPDNFDEPSHVAMREVAAEGDRPWSEALRDQGVRQPFQSPAEIYNQFKPLCSEVDIWHTSYYHILDDHQAIVEWVKGTGLRPFVDPLSPEARQAFLDAYLDRIRRLYPPLHDGKVCLRYPRLFVVAVRA